MTRSPHDNDHDRVQRMVALSAPVEEVWAAIGGFGGIANWHPLIESVEIVEIEGEIYRHLTTADDEKFFERLIETGPHHLTYEVVEGPLPASDYRATLACVAETEGCHVFWSGYFIPADGMEKVSDDIVGAFYEMGLEALRDRFA